MNDILNNKLEINNLINNQNIPNNNILVIDPKFHNINLLNDNQDNIPNYNYMNNNNYNFNNPNSNQNYNNNEVNNNQNEEEEFFIHLMEDM